MKTSYKGGFSLIELLVALSILAVVAAIIVPRFLNVRTSASQTAGMANMKEFQNMIRNFIALGGQIGATPVAGDIANFISGNGGTRGTATTSGTALGNVNDSSGTMGSFTIVFNPAPTVPGTAIDPTKSSTFPTSAGFYVSAKTAGASVYYYDGNGSVWTLTVDSSGNLAAAAGSADAVGAQSYTAGQL